MIKFLDILKEDLTKNTSGEYVLKFPLTKGTSLSNTDYFFIRDRKPFVKLNGVSIYGGIFPNNQFEFTSDDLNNIYSQFKNLKNIQIDDLKRILTLTKPKEVNYHFIVKLGSSAPLNDLIVNHYKKQFSVPDEHVLKLDKLLYTLDTLVNIDKYNKADKVTRKIVDTFLAQLRSIYKPDEKFPIKVSPNTKKGIPGLQSGGRILLNPRYNSTELEKIKSTSAKILIIDDVHVSGEGLREAIQALLKKGIPSGSITGYVFANKPSKKERIPDDESKKKVQSRVSKIKVRK